MNAVTCVERLTNGAKAVILPAPVDAPMITKPAGIGTATGIALPADMRSVAHSELRVIVFPDSPKAWTARSLERDLAARGATADAAIDTLIRIAQAHVEFDTRHGRVPLSAFAAAPRLYWNAFARADNVHSVTMCRPERDLTIQCSVARLPEHPIIARYNAQVRSA